MTRRGHVPPATARRHLRGPLNRLTPPPPALPATSTWASSAAEPETGPCSFAAPQSAADRGRKRRKPVTVRGKRVATRPPRPYAAMRRPPVARPFAISCSTPGSLRPLDARLAPAAGRAAPHRPHAVGRRRHARRQRRVGVGPGHRGSRGTDPRPPLRTPRTQGSARTPIARDPAFASAPPTVVAAVTIRGPSLVWVQNLDGPRIPESRIACDPGARAAGRGNRSATPDDPGREGRRWFTLFEGVLLAKRPHPLRGSNASGGLNHRPSLRLARPKRQVVAGLSLKVVDGNRDSLRCSGQFVEEVADEADGASRASTEQSRAPSRDRRPWQPFRPAARCKVGGADRLPSLGTRSPGGVRRPSSS